MHPVGSRLRTRFAYGYAETRNWLLSAPEDIEHDSEDIELRGFHMRRTMHA